MDDFDTGTSAHAGSFPLTDAIDGGTDGRHRTYSFTERVLAGIALVAVAIFACVMLWKFFTK